MRANGDVIRNEAPGVPLDWEGTRGWAERTFSKERIGQAGIAVAGFAAFLALVGLVEYSLFQAIENWSITGVGASVFGYF
jgi:hypothetical protein